MDAEVESPLEATVRVPSCRAHMLALARVSCSLTAPNAEFLHGKLTMNNLIPSYPSSWTKELVRNPSGRAFWFVSRFVSRTTLEYVKDVTGSPKCFRQEAKANAAADERNGVATRR